MSQTIKRYMLFHYHNLFEVSFGDMTYYLYNLPYYESMQNGSSLFPSGNYVYMIKKEVFDFLLSFTDKKQLQCYVETHIDDELLLHHRLPEGFDFLGDSKDKVGTLMSKILQMVVSRIYT